MGRPQDGPGPNRDSENVSALARPQRAEGRARTASSPACPHPSSSTSLSSSSTTVPSSILVLLSPNLLPAAPAFPSPPYPIQFCHSIVSLSSSAPISLPAATAYPHPSSSSTLPYSIQKYHRRVSILPQPFLSRPAAQLSPHLPRNQCGVSSIPVLLSPNH